MEMVEVQGSRVWCDGSTGTWRPVIPPQLRGAVLAQVHGLAHPGIRATCRLVSARYVWPSLAEECKEYCRSCVACNRAKVLKHEHTPVEKISTPEAKFQHIHVDLVGPLPPSSQGYTHLLTVVDRSTRWPEAVPLKNVEAATVLEAFLGTWVARYGVPAFITTDRGAQFTSSTWTDWCQQVGARHITTTAFHPQSNGLVERFHRQLKDALRARGAATTWADHLPWALLGLRVAPKEESGISSAQAAFGQELVVPGQLSGCQRSAEAATGSADPTEDPTEQSAGVDKSWAELAAGSSPLDRAEWVYIRRGGQGRPLADNYAGPYQVMEKAVKYFKVLVGSKVDSISRDRLKPHLGTRPPEAATPPRRGRPPGTGGNLEDPASCAGRS